ncbi:220cbb02-e1b0-48ba-8115-41a91af26eff [Thermothielavioides terrestris]|uniref:C2H2-type domain-containing protein n=2 Tax=Thermothielavioides terrestris TaxID=2587410 RepID=G2RIE1_THETT|nr:uncharacterized protein THITE_2124193 [Thermothielavioides terrestris NRRL 8126]AEO71603.1 hypothetical protein THITE_2124193 [Thermothielavioides terrestris NRRL 8126]SPQ27412.1 220cbb02-e1b0-48ba-8115-41a91af26eff [Thermothielavioides terrestris]
MEHTPPPSLTRSPASPANTYCPSEGSSLDYPSPGLVEQQYKLSSMYGDQSCVTPSMNPEMSLPPLDSMGHPDWNNTTVIHPGSSASGMPSILSADYETFGSFPYSHDGYHPHSLSHPPSIHAATPPPTASAPRSPAAPLRTPYTPATSVPGPMTPRVKLEGTSDYSHSTEASHYPSPRSVQTSYQSDSGPYAASTSTGYLSDSGSTTWHKPEYQPVEPDHFYPGPPPPQPPAFLHDARRQYRVTRPRRTPRRLTTKEEANFQCEVKGCGKLFSRSYNFKAHMETHDEKREYPFPCQVPECNKKFVRKTDLQRHHQSVHLRERTHKCDYCGRMFARKDTLRRHMEDGCSKRFDIGTLDLRADAFDSLHPSTRTMAPLGPLLPSSGGLPPMATPPLCSSSVFPSLPPTMRPREPLAAGDHSQGHSWGR